MDSTGEWIFKHQEGHRAMDCFRIEGGRRLSGRVAVEGSKNASLPLMAAALLSDGPVDLAGIPDLSDTANMLRLLEELGLEPGDARGERHDPLHQPAKDLL